MKRKQIYLSPAVVNTVPLALSDGILAGSKNLLDYIDKIETVGQEVDYFENDYSGSWEE